MVYPGLSSGQDGAGAWVPSSLVIGTSYVAINRIHPSFPAGSSYHRFAPDEVLSVEEFDVRRGRRRPALNLHTRRGAYPFVFAVPGPDRSNVRDAVTALHTVLTTGDRQ